jgi:3-hydroxyacyl-CoA dehydrogenase
MRRSGAHASDAVARARAQVERLPLCTRRAAQPYVQEALYQLEEGCLPKDVDAAIGPKGFGMAMGPFTMSDLAGNDIGAFVRRELGWIDGANAAEPNRRYWASIADELVARGRLGQKTKKGWYDYSAGRARRGANERTSSAPRHQPPVPCWFTLSFSHAAP